LKHFLMMMLFAAFVALIFGIVGREGGRDRLFYGLKIFAEFMGVGLGLAWLLYLIPW
jgi:hypothetical protein